MKKTSPKKLHPMAQTNRQTNRQTNGHGDSMTDPAQRAESVKMVMLIKLLFLPPFSKSKPMHKVLTRFTCVQTMSNSNTARHDTRNLSKERL